MKKVLLCLLLVFLTACSGPYVSREQIRHAEAVCAGNDGLKALKIERKHSLYGNALVVLARCNDTAQFTLDIPTKSIKWD